MADQILSSKNLANHNQQMMGMNPISHRDINGSNPLAEVRQSKKRGAGASSDLVGKNRGPRTDVRQYDMKPPMYDLSPSPQRNPGGFIG